MNNGKMEEDVKPKDEDGVDGRGVSGWDGWVCVLGRVHVSSIFGLVLRAGSFTGGLLTFTLVSGLQLAQLNCVTCHFFSAVFSSQLEVMSLVRTSGVHSKKMQDWSLISPRPPFSLRTPPIRLCLMWRPASFLPTLH
jgi:hypothetical protein